MFMNKLSKWMRTLAEIIINHKKIIVILLEDRLLVILINNSPINHYQLNQIYQVHKSRWIFKAIRKDSCRTKTKYNNNRYKLNRIPQLNSHSQSKYSLQSNLNLNPQFSKSPNRNVIFNHQNL